MHKIYVPRTRAAHDKVMAAISIIQAKAMALDSCTGGPESWGPMYFESGCLDVAIDLLIEVLGEIEDVKV